VSNLYLNNFLSPICQSYGGCFSCNNIPTVCLDQEVSFIVNLSKEAEIGTHFVALIIKKNSVFYFDSYGHECTNQDILDYLQCLSRTIVYNNLKVQSDESKMCGFFCALIVIRNDNTCIDKSDLLFHTSIPKLHLNDTLCIDYICRALEQICPE